MSDLFKFDIQGNQVLAAYEYEHGIFLFERLEEGEFWTVELDGNNTVISVSLFKQEDGGPQLEDLFLPVPGTGVFVKLEDGQTTLGNGSIDTGKGGDDQYKFTIVNGIVTEVYEFENGLWERKTPDSGETYLVDGLDVVKTEQDDDGGIDVDRFVDPDGNGIYVKSESQNYDEDDLPVFEQSRRSERRGVGNSNDVFSGDKALEADDKFDGGAGNDKLNGYGGDDDLAGGDNDDQINGGLGDDFLNGGDGRDKLNGGNDDDDLVGGRSADQLTGGLGSDDFIYSSVAESGPLGTSRDRINDFKSGIDHLDLSAIDADETEDFDQAFSYIGSAAFTGVAGELRFAKGFLQGDTDGDKVADFVVQMKGATLLASDIYL
ncbi:MAG: calcium-binding protein [Cyanobium sp.]